MINHVVLVGRVVRDSELKYSNGGMAVCKFSLAVNKRRKDADDKVNFFDCTIFGKTAEALNQYLVKGKEIAIEGELSQSRWEQDGSPRSKIEVLGNNVQLLGGPKEGGKVERYEPPEAPSDGFEDDIPF